MKKNYTEQDVEQILTDSRFTSGAHKKTLRGQIAERFSGMDELSMDVLDKVAGGVSKPEPGGLSGSSKSK